MAGNGIRTLHRGSTDDWNTPADFVARVKDVGRIALDPCSNLHSVVKADENLLSGGIEKYWGEVKGKKRGGIVFVNPPYSDARIWAHKISQEARMGIQIVALMPCRTDTRHFHLLAGLADALCFVRGRIFFTLNGEAKGKPSFPSVVFYFGKNVEKFEKAFEPIGLVY